MKISELRIIKKIREQINLFEGIKCGMVHERVKIDKSTKLPVYSGIKENSFKRVSLCPKEIRSKRLACGHTNVRNYLRNAVSELSKFNEFDKSLLKVLNEKINKTDLDICTLDHKKGFAEMDYAVKLNEVYNLNTGIKSIEKILDEDLQNEKAVIRNLEISHGVYVYNMIELQKEILHILNKVITKESKKIKHRIFS